MHYVKYMPYHSMCGASRNRREICAALECGYQVSVFSTDSSREGTLLPDDVDILFDGEIYDARLEGKQEWTRPVRRKAPQGRLMLQTGPSDKVVRSLAPVSVKDMGEGEVSTSPKAVRPQCICQQTAVL